MALDPSPQHLVSDQIRLFHVCVPTAHHRTAKRQKKKLKVNTTHCFGPDAATSVCNLNKSLSHNTI